MRSTTSSASRSKTTSRLMRTSSHQNRTRAHLPLSSHAPPAAVTMAVTHSLAFPVEVSPPMQFRSFGLVFVETRTHDQAITAPFDAVAASLGTEEANATR